MPAVDSFILVVVIICAALVILEMLEARKNDTWRQIHLTDNLDIKFPRKGSARYLCALDGVDSKEVKGTPAIDFNHDEEPIEIETIYDLPKLFCDRHCKERMHDYIVRARDGSTIRFTLDYNACAWRTYEPLKEKFV